MNEHTSHPSTVLPVFPSCRNDKQGKHTTTPKAKRGTPLFVQYRRILEAFPSSARPYRFRVAQYVYVFPAEKIEVIIRAFIRCDRPLTPRFCIAITYGEAEAVPAPPLPLKIATNFGSL